ncbi:MAG: DUF998 domain-containing protein [Ginsengibacter sp.]
MQKVFLLFLLLFVSQEIFAQDNLRTIKATSMSVDIRVDNDYFAKGGWALDSSKKPDVFSIGSKWLYKTKKVTFTTDIDSISFNVQPNGKYNFIILLNQKTPCYIQIATLANPVFMNKKIIIPILLGLIMIIVLYYLNRNKFSIEKLLYFGFVTPILFWLMTFLSGAIHGNYNHFKNVISELGAIGTKSEIFTSSSLVILAVLCILFSIGFYRASKKFNLSVIPAILSFSMPITMIWAGIFTLGNEFHSLTGPLPFLIIFGCLLAYLLWKRNKEFSELSNISLISFIISLFILLRFIKPFGYEYEGLVQRFFYLAWTVWTFTIAHYFSRKLKDLTS